MSIGREFEAFKTTTIEGIAEFYTAQVKAGMRGPLADVCSLVGGGIGGFIIYPFRRVITRKSPDMIIRQAKSRIDYLCKD